MRRRTLRDPRKEKKLLRYRIAELLSREENLLGMDIPSITRALQSNYHDVNFCLCDELNDQQTSKVGYSKTREVWFLYPNVDHIRFDLGLFTKTSTYKGILAEFIEWGLDTHLMFECKAKHSLVVENLFHVATNRDATWSPSEDIRMEWIKGLGKLNDSPKYNDVIVHLENKRAFTQDVLVLLTKSIGGGLRVSLKGDNSPRTVTMDDSEFTISNKLIKSLTDACDEGVYVP